MRFISNRKHMLLKRSLMVLNVLVFMNFGFIKAMGSLTEEIIKYGKRIASDEKDIQFSSQPAQALRQISDKVKTYFNEKRLPVEKLSKERELGVLIIAYGFDEKEADLSARLLDVFRVAAGIVRRSIVSKEPVKVDIFAPLSCDLSLSETLSKLIFQTSLSSEPIDASLWADPNFCSQATFVFFAILPDVPAEYSLFGSQGRISPASSDEGSVGSSRSRSPKTPQAETSFVSRLWGYFFGGQTT